MSKKKIKILVLDDEDTILSMLKYSFTQEGYEVATTTNYIGLGYSLKDFEPDLIILDVMLPGSYNGEQICKQIRHHHKDLIIIFYSAIETDILERITKESGADDYISKDERLEVLNKKIQEILKK